MTLKMDGVMGQEDRYCHLSNQVCYSSNKNLIHKSTKYLPQRET